MTFAPMHKPPELTLANVRRNIADLPSALTFSGFTAALVVLLINYTGPVLIILQAATAGNLSAAQTASWIWSAMIGYGVASISMSLLFRQPIIAPYSTAGASLLVTSIALYPLPEVIGAYVLVAIGLIALGVSGLFGRVMRLIPQPVALAVLAGVLMHFGLGLFNAMDDDPLNPLMIAAMVAAYFVGRRLQWRAPALLAMAVGAVVAAAQGALHFQPLDLSLTQPVVMMPVFTLKAAVGLALPLFALALSSQYTPGLAVLRGNNYDAPINGILTVTGIVSFMAAFFVGHGVSLGALTAAIVVGKESNPDADKRYGSAVMAGVLHIVFGLFGMAVFALFSAFPAVFVSTVAGLSLSGAIASSLGGAMEKPEYRDAAVIAFLCTAGDFHLFDIGAPFWGLLAGIVVYALTVWGKKLKT